VLELRKKGLDLATMATPMTVLTANTRRETGKKAQFGNIMAAKVTLDMAADLDLGIHSSTFNLRLLVSGRLGYRKDNNGAKCDVENDFRCKRR
jgi:hypothetical protein